MINIIVSAAGKSTRFNGLKPKWMLTHPSGNTMLTMSLGGLNFDDTSRLYIVLLKKHLDNFISIKSLEKELKDNIKVNFIKIIILEDETNSQSETVYNAIKKESIEGPIFIKDCDNFFISNISNKNCISYVDIGDFDIKKLKNKSYLTLEFEKEKILIKSIDEKKINSKYMCVSGYSFFDSSLFLESYMDIHPYYSNEEMYISQIINNLIKNKSQEFELNKVYDFVDWGTKDDWINYISTYKTYFIDIDGVLFENASKHMNPAWGKSDPIIENINIIKKLYNNKSEIILTTARNIEFKEATEMQLKLFDIKYHQIIYGLRHNKRIIINDYSDTNKYPSCESINIERNIGRLSKFIDT